jgi:hypothetical protein
MKGFFPYPAQSHGWATFGSRGKNNAIGISWDDFYSKVQPDIRWAYIILYIKVVMNGYRFDSWRLKRGVCQNKRRLKKTFLNKKYH